MINTIFIWILNQGIELGVIVLCLLPLRVVLRKTAPRAFAYLLWCAIPVSLICSLLTVVTAPLLFWSVAIVDETMALNFRGNVLQICKWVLLIGIVVMICYRVVSYLRLRKRLVGSIRLREKIYVTDRISAPFSMGVLHPRVYLPFSLAEEYYEPVILHEKVHISRKDLWMNYIAMGLLVVFWFQPMLWIAYPLFIKDMEGACDETVIRKQSVEFRACYAEALVEVSYRAGKLGAVVAGYGGGEIEERIIHVMKYKKPKRWAKICMAVLSIEFVLIAIPVARRMPHVFWLDDKNLELENGMNIIVKDAGIKVKAVSDE